MFFLIFIDIESNGLHLLRHVPLQIALTLVCAKSGTAIESYNSFLSCSKEEWQQSSLESLKIHGLTFEDIQNAPSRQEVCEVVLSFFKRHKLSRHNAAFIGQNSSFDRALFAKIVDPDLQEKLYFPYYWLEMASMHWARHHLLQENSPPVWQIGFSKNRIAKHHCLDLEPYPHKAENGVSHLIECYNKVINLELLDKITK